MTLHHETNRLIAALIVIAADGHPGKRWDLIEDYYRALDEMREQEEERHHVRSS